MADVVEVEMVTEQPDVPDPEDTIKVAPPIEKFHLTYSPLKDELSSDIRSACSLMPPADFTVHPSDCVLPSNYSNYAKRIIEMDVREDDVWVLSFPKCGSRLVREMVWLLNNSLDFEKARATDLHKRFLFLEYVCLWPEGADRPDTVAMVEEAPSPRFIKSNLPVELLPRQLWTKRPKIIYVGRNPKDSALSYFSHYQQFYQYSGSQDQFFQAFHRDRVAYSPFWEHVLAFWEKRKELSLLFVTYEETTQNLSSSVRKMSAFLGTTLSMEEDSKLVKHLQRDETDHEGVSQDKVLSTSEGDAPTPASVEPTSTGAKSTPKELGSAGYWRTSMTPSCAEKFDKWTKEKLAGTDFSNVFMII